MLLLDNPVRSQQAQHAEPLASKRGHDLMFCFFVDSHSHSGLCNCPGGRGVVPPAQGSQGPSISLQLSPTIVPRRPFFSFCYVPAFPDRAGPCTMHGQ